MDSMYIRVAKRRRSGQSGFTLIELLVVIAVLAILAGVVLFNVVGVTNRGSTAACNTDVKTLQTAADAYLNDHPTGFADTTTPAWVNALTGASPPYLHTLTGAGVAGSSCKTTLTLSGTASGGYTVAGTTP